MKHIKYLENCIKSLFVFFLFLFINRALFLKENPDFVLNQSHATSKWLSSNLPIINIATFAPLVIAVLWLIAYVYFICRNIVSK